MLRTVISVVLFFLTISILNYLTEVSTEEIEPIELRIKHLKSQIFEEIKAKVNKAPFESDHYEEIYDYVDNSNKPIIPISDDDERKLYDRYKKPELKSTMTTTKYVTTPEKVDEKIGPLRSKKQKKKKPIETFYRRMAFNPNERDRPQKWTHCLDLLSPFLNGYLSNVTDHKKVSATDPEVTRLRKLLTLDMTDATNEEIKATLYQISNLQIRMFQWDMGAVKAILNVIIADRSHNFKGLKHGLKSIFDSWKLNTSNLTRVLTQSRILRPPCIQITNYGGSTVTPKAIRYSKPETEKQKNCNYRKYYDDDC